MLETAIGARPEKLWLQQEISKASRMDANITAFLVGITSGYRQVTFLRSMAIRGRRRRFCCSSIIGLELFVRVIDEILFVIHCGKFDSDEYGMEEFDLKLVVKSFTNDKQLSLMDDQSRRCTLRDK